MTTLPSCIVSSRQTSIHDVPTSIQCVILTYLPFKSAICMSVTNKSWSVTFQRREAKGNEQDFLIKAHPATVQKWLKRISILRPRSLVVRSRNTETGFETPLVPDPVILSRKLCQSIHSLTIEHLDFKQTLPYWFMNLTSLTLLRPPLWTLTGEVTPSSHVSRRKTSSHYLQQIPMLKEYVGVLDDIWDWMYLPRTLTSLSLQFQTLRSMPTHIFDKLLDHFHMLQYIDVYVDELEGEVKGEAVTPETEDGEVVTSPEQVRKTEDDQVIPPLALASKRLALASKRLAFASKRLV